MHGEAPSQAVGQELERMLQLLREVRDPPRLHPDERVAADRAQCGTCAEGCRDGIARDAVERGDTDAHDGEECDRGGRGSSKTRAEHTDADDSGIEGSSSEEECGEKRRRETQAASSIAEPGEAEYRGDHQRRRVEAGEAEHRGGDHQRAASRETRSSSRTSNPRGTDGEQHHEKARGERADLPQADAGRVYSELRL